MDRTLFILAAALVVDRLVGEPRWLWDRLPHPVVLIGRAIAGLEARLNGPALAFRKRRANGVWTAAAIGGASLALGWLVSAAARAVPMGAVLEVAAVSTLLAQRSLLDHVRAVEQALRCDGIAKGRAEVANIVGRDVSALDESGVSRAAIESLAENYSDGLVGPALWYALLGLPGLFLYKAASTADSMIGHRSERYAAFGWAAARLDDLLNLIPARLAALNLALAAALCRRDWRGALRSVLRDASKHRSPNAGWPEAATAGALGLALGGPRRYGADLVEGVWLNGQRRKTADPDDIRAALQLVEASWAVLVTAVAIMAFAIWQ